MLLCVWERTRYCIITNYDFINLSILCKECSNAKDCTIYSPVLIAFLHFAFGGVGGGGGGGGGSSGQLLPRASRSAILAVSERVSE